MVKLMHFNKLFLSLVIIPVLFICINCGGGGGGSETNQDPAPDKLVYASTSALYTKNIKIADNIPSYTGVVTDWSVDPALPQGLALDKITGIISGTPVSDQDAVNYTITAVNAKGSATAKLSISIKEAPPAALTYTVTSAVYTIDSAITENVPSFYGTVTSCSISPDLPE